MNKVYILVFYLQVDLKKFDVKYSKMCIDHFEVVIDNENEA